MVRAHIFFSGRVQGVFFRNTVAKKAKKAGILGWVRNLEDSRVEAIFEGEKEKIEDMVQGIKKNNPLARIDNIDLKWEDYKGEFNEFEIMQT